MGHSPNILVSLITRQFQQFAGLLYPEFMKNSPTIPVPSITQLFKQFVELNNPELMKYSPTILVPLITREFKKFCLVPLTRTNKIFSYEPYSLKYSVFQKVELYIELMKYCLMILLPSITRQFKQFNSVVVHRIHEIFFNDPSSLNYSITLRSSIGIISHVFGVVKSN